MRNKRFATFRGTVSGLMSSPDEDDETIASDPFGAMRQPGDGVFRQGTEVLWRETAQRSSTRKKRLVANQENALADAFLKQAPPSPKKKPGRRDTTTKPATPIKGRADEDEDLPTDPVSRRRELVARRDAIQKAKAWNDRVIAHLTEHVGTGQGLKSALRRKAGYAETLTEIEDELRILNFVLGPPKSVIAQAPQPVPATSAALAGPRDRRGLN